MVLQPRSFGLVSKGRHANVILELVSMARHAEFILASKLMGVLTC